MRKEVRFEQEANNGDEGLELIVTDAGIEVSGWYNQYACLSGQGTLSLTWAQIDAARMKVKS